MTTTITFLTEELLVDISNRCSLAAKAAKTDGGDTHDTEDVLDDGNRELVLNIIARLMFECVNLLYPFAKRPLADQPRDNRTAEVEAYAIALSFPYERSETQLQELSRTMHDYVVTKCFAEWLSLTLPTADWQRWERKAQDLRDAIATALVTPLHPRTLKVRPHFY